MSTTTKLDAMFDKDAFAKAFAAASPTEQAKALETVRNMYVKSIANTEQVLEPARLRALDANIAELKTRR
jgi:hypothetical protein